MVLKTKQLNKQQIKIKQQMKKIYLSVIATLVAVSGILVSCTADDEFEANQPAYSYSASEVQEILELQEEYGVGFSFKQTSDRPLPSVEKMEELCKVIAMMQSSAKHGVKRNNSVRFSSARKRTPKVEYGGEKYSGSWSDHCTKNGVGTFDYEIYWKDIIPTFDKHGEVWFEILSEPNLTGAYFDYGFSYRIEGSGTICYTIHVTVNYDGSLEQSSFDINGECEA